MMPGGGRFGDWGKGPKMEGEPWIVHYTAYPHGKATQGRIKVWTKRGKEGAIERVKYQAQRGGFHVTIWHVYQPGRTPAGLYVPEGMEEVPE
jgi:hypothetical protein